MPDFYKQLKAELNKCGLTKPKLNKLVKDCLIAVNKAAITKTPIDTGLAVNNWFISEGSPSNQFERTPIATDISQTGYAEPSNIPSIRAKAQVRAMNFPVDVESQSEYFVTNNTEYIDDLEGGKSSQASEGILAPAITEAEKEVNDIVRDFKRNG